MSTTMTYEVLTKNLRAGAADYTTVAGHLGHPPDITHVDPDSFGHIELAAWLKAVVDQCGKADTALKQGASGLADSLNTSARYYDTADDNASQCISTPVTNGWLPPSSWNSSGNLVPPGLNNPGSTPGATP